MRNVSLVEALGEAHETYTKRRPKTRQAHDAASAYMPGGNTRTVLYHAPFPLRVVVGAGPTLTDLDGLRYVNMLGEYTAGLFGHSDPLIIAELHRALDDGLNLGAHTIYETRLAELVTARFPAIQSVRFTNSGTEANLMAVSLARYATGRSDVMVFTGGYHGGVLYFAGVGSPINAPFPYRIGRYNDVAAVRAAIRDAGEKLACVIVEPMLGSGGCIPADPAFLQMLSAETQKTGALLICDEVMTSRFGRHGASALVGITPDLVTLGKWVGGGMTFGAFGGRADLMALFDPRRPDALPHAGTFNNNVLTMRAGAVALGQVFTGDVAESLHARGEALRAKINDLFAGNDVPMHATGLGSLMTIHGRAGPITMVSDLATSVDARKELVFLDLLEAGYYVARRGFIALSLALSDGDISGFVDALTHIVRTRGPALRSAS